MVKLGLITAGAGPFVAIHQGYWPANTGNLVLAIGGGVLAFIAVWIVGEL